MDTDGVGTPSQGASVAVSADGNTAIVGGPQDSSGVGAAWVFTRSGGMWTQQGKLVGTGNMGASQPGASVSVSADGNTAIVGGPNDASGVGAAWVFTRSGVVWTQQGKLVGTGNMGASEQGASIALSGDGNTAVLGGPNDASGVGAAWVFTRSGVVWNQQGELTPAVALQTANAKVGFSVALSGDGNTVIIGGCLDILTGPIRPEAWVFTRSGGVWTQQQSFLILADDLVTPGASVALSADGNGDRGRFQRQLRYRRGVGVHAQRWGVDGGGQQAGGHEQRGRFRARRIRRAIR